MDTLYSFYSLPIISLRSSNFLRNNQTQFIINSSVNSTINHLNYTLINQRNQNYCKDIRQLKVRVKAINDVSEAFADPIQAQVTWQIIVGALAGAIPFIVAGIEFSKRIAAQRKCEVCGGSGLVLRDKKYYFRCPGCGGFLPWQSWRRFFSG